jgi:hypothetical protein
LFRSHSDPKTTAPTPTSQSTATTTRGTTTPTSGALRFGTAQRYDDGVQVTVASPRPFTPSDTAAGYTPGDKAVAFDVTATNGSDHNMDLGLVSVDAKDADGRSAERVFDSAKGISGDPSGTLLPGKKSVATYVFDLPKRASATWTSRSGPASATNLPCGVVPAPDRRRLRRIGGR